MSKTKMYVIRVSLHDQHFLKAERAGTDHVCQASGMALVNTSLFFTTPVHMAELATLYGVDALKILEDCLACILPEDMAEYYGYNEKCEFIDQPLRGPHCPCLHLLSINPDVLPAEYTTAVKNLIDNRRFFVDETTGFPRLDLFGISMAEYKKRKAEEALAKEQAPTPQQKTETLYLSYVMTRDSSGVRMEEFGLLPAHPSDTDKSSCLFSVDGDALYLHATVLVALEKPMTCDEFILECYGSREWREKMLGGLCGRVKRAFFSSDGSRNCFGDFIIEGRKNPEELEKLAGNIFFKIVGGIEETLKDVGDAINQVKQSGQLSQARAMIKTLLQGVKKGDVDVVDVGVDVRGKKYALRMNGQLGASDWMTLHKAKIFMGGEVEVGRYIVPTAMMEQFKEAMGE